MSEQIRTKERRIQRDSSQALFSQLEELLREGIEDGTWLPGEPIPSERELSKIHELSRMTVRRAIDRLVAAGPNDPLSPRSETGGRVRVSRGAGATGEQATI